LIISAAKRGKDGANMATTWQNLSTVKKGNIGERLVNEFLIKKDFIPYSPDATGAHPFDRLVASRDKRTIFIADSKTKAARKYYPDTGIDIRHYNEYKFIQDKYNIEVFLFFVDEEKLEIYGNILSRLDEVRTVLHNGKFLSYPWEHQGIRYFPLEKMQHIANIPTSEAMAMKTLTSKKIEYR
jgi:hypothetical protein